MEMEDDVGIAECRKNPCPREEMSPMDSQCIPRDNTRHASCHTIGKRAPCKGGAYLLVEPTIGRPFCTALKPNSIVPRIVKRAAPCQLSYLTPCVRECSGPDSYPFFGSCAEDYVYLWNYGRPICFKSRCRRA